MKVMKLKETMYFDDDGFSSNSMEEAKEESVFSEDAYFIRIQKVKIYEAGEIKDQSLYDKYKYYVFSMKGRYLFGTENLQMFEEIKEK